MHSLCWEDCILTRQVTNWTVQDKLQIGLYNIQSNLSPVLSKYSMYITMQRSKLCLNQVYSLPGKDKHVVKINVIETKFHSLMIQQCLSKLCRYLTVDYVPGRIIMIPFKQLSNTGYYKAIIKQPEFDRTGYNMLKSFRLQSNAIHWLIYKIQLLRHACSGVQERYCVYMVCTLDSEINTLFIG